MWLHTVNDINLIFNLIDTFEMKGYVDVLSRWL